MTEEKRQKVTIPDLYAMREKGEIVSWLTCYDFPTAQLMEEAGIEMILVGDSASMVVYGNDSTLPATMDMQIAHTEAVRRGAPTVFLIGDMPFLSYHISTQDAVANAGRFMKEAGCDAIKLEGGVRVADKVKAIVDAGIPVMGHIGLTPQSSAMLGGFKVQGKDAETAKNMIADAKALEEAGVFGILMECVPTKVSQIIKKKVSVMTYGIGAGSGCDGQLLIVHDIIGLYQCFTPKFVKQYANIAPIMLDAFKSYKQEVRDKTFPQKEHEFMIKKSELAKLEELDK